MQGINTILKLKSIGFNQKILMKKMFMSILKMQTESLYQVALGDRGVEGKITTIKYAREKQKYHSSVFV